LTKKKAPAKTLKKNSSPIAPPAKTFKKLVSPKALKK
jgi:hypothetical protein